MTFGEIYEVMSAISEKDQTAKELFEVAIKKACQYAKIRIDWNFMNTSEKSVNDKGRSIKHNSFIDSLNIMSRYCVSIGIDNQWRTELGEERRYIGDYACYIAYRVGVEVVSFAEFE